MGIRAKKKIYFPAGSALVLVVVMISLLAVMGVMFVMSTRVNKMSTSAISENKELTFAIEAAVTLISEQLEADVPGLQTDYSNDYYDYPDSQNAWLASMEPFELNGDYFWRQISDFPDTSGINAEDLFAQVVDDYQPPEEVHVELPADADGDGITDSRWITLDDITSNKGRQIYAAIRVIDNCGMVNVNTAAMFNENTTISSLIDGSNQMQVDLESLIDDTQFVNYFNDDIDDFHLARSADPLNIASNWPIYQNEAIWPLNLTAVFDKDHLPFDISDEVELRNRYVIRTLARTRLKNELSTSIGPTFNWVPQNEVKEWYEEIKQIHPQPDRRHYLTAYNFDRIIRPDYNIGYDDVINDNETTDRMVNINATDKDEIYDVLEYYIEDANVAAQLAVNIADYSDNDSIVSYLPAPGGIVYGFEAQPFISEVLINYTPLVPFPPKEPNAYYTIELYNPSDVDVDLSSFSIELWYDNDEKGQIALSGNIAAQGYFVITTDSGVEAQFSVGSPGQSPSTSPSTSKLSQLFGGWPFGISQAMPDADAAIYLRRNVTGNEIYVDAQDVYNAWIPQNGGISSATRDMRDWRIVYQNMVLDSGESLWAGPGPSLNFSSNDDPNSFFLPNTGGGFVTVGDISRILTIGNSTIQGVTINTIGQQLRDHQEDLDPEDEIRLNLKDPNNLARIDLAEPNLLDPNYTIFQYLTVFDPAGQGGNSAGESRIRGRININTAPWQVIATLPWVGPELAQAIVAYRDKTTVMNQDNPGETIVDYTGDNNGRRDSIASSIINSVDRIKDDDQIIIRENRGFASIAELNYVVGVEPGTTVPEPDRYTIDWYQYDTLDPDAFPDLTADTNPDDFEERDAIFSRISNLVTVRSDVFTAYILVRIGNDGPQKRVIAILDRSQVNSSSDSVRVVALHEVPDPR